MKDNAYLFEVLLRRLFSATHLLKVGFGFDSDLKGMLLARCRSSHRLFLSQTDLECVVLRN